MQYHFLLLSLVFAIPGILTYWLRPDLRIIIRRMMLFSIPFGFSEFLFYPEYWEPTFLFDLAAKIGFGLEDFLFVMGLAAFSGTGYAVIFKKTIHTDKLVSAGQIAWRLGILGLITIFLTLSQVLMSVPMIYGAMLTMFAAALGIAWFRHDLTVPMILGGFISVTVYFVLCRVLLLLVPEIFELNWHLEAFSGTYIFGVPLEELLYGFAAGFIGTIFYPFVFSCRYVALRFSL